MMNATATLVSAFADRTHAPLPGSVDVPDFWQMALSLRKAIYKCCLGYMNGNAADAEDAVQDVLIHASQKYLKYAGEIKNFAAWMLQVTKNFCLTRLRKLAKQATGVDDIELVSALGGIDRDYADDSPVSSLLSNEESALIDDAIASLPETLRSTYRLHYYEQRSNTEIADRLGITKANVYQRLSRAKKMLVPKLRGYFCSSEDTTLEQQTAPMSKPTPRASSAGSAAARNSKFKIQNSKCFGSKVRSDCPDGALFPPCGSSALSVASEGSRTDQAPVQDSGPVTFSGAPEKGPKIQNSQLKIGEVPENKVRSPRELHTENSTPITPHRELALSPRGTRETLVPTSVRQLLSPPISRRDGKASNPHDYVTSDPNYELRTTNYELTLVPGPEREEKLAPVDGGIPSSEQYRKVVERCDIINNPDILGNRVSGPHGTPPLPTGLEHTPSYPEELPSTDRCLDEAHLSNTQITPEPDLSPYKVPQEILGLLTNLATRLSGDFGNPAERTGSQPCVTTSQQLKILYSEFKIGKVPENKERALWGHSNFNARQLTYREMASCRESPLIIPWTWFLRGYRALTNLANVSSTDASDQNFSSGRKGLKPP